MLVDASNDRVTAQITEFGCKHTRLTSTWIIKPSEVARGCFMSRQQVLPRCWHSMGSLRSSSGVLSQDFRNIRRAFLGCAQWSHENWTIQNEGPDECEGHL